jgi:hypothetical protein
MGQRLKLPGSKNRTNRRVSYPPHENCGGRLIYTGGGWVVCALCRKPLYLGRVQGKDSK